MPKTKIQFKKIKHESLIRKLLNKDELLATIVGDRDYHTYDLCMNESVFLAIKINKKIVGIVFLIKEAHDLYNVHCGLYREGRGNAFILGQILLNFVLPQHFKGNTLRAQILTTNRLSLTLAKKLGFIHHETITKMDCGKMKDFNILYYEVK